MSSSDSLPTVSLEATADAEQSAGSLPSGTLSSSYSGDTLTLRQLSRESGFVQIITCYSGCVTVLQGSQEATDPFVQALAGKESSVPVDARLGIRELHTSEVYLVSGVRKEWRGKTVEGALLAAGATDDDVAHMLDIMQMKGDAQRHPDQLDEAARRRLAIACALFSKAHVLLFVKPFAGQTVRWIQTCASLFVEAARQSSQKFVVVGIGTPPAVWRASDIVHIETIETATAIRKRNTLELPSAPRGLLASRSSDVAPDPYVLTRPQHVSASQVSTEDALQSEAIVNPHLVELLSTSEADSGETPRASGSKWTSSDPAKTFKATNVSSAARDSSARRRRSLTYVSRGHRILRTSPIVVFFRNFSKSLKAALRDQNYTDTALPAVKLEASRKKYRVEQAIGVCALLILFLTAWLLFSHSM